MKCKYAAQAAKALDEMKDTGNTTEEEEDEMDEREVGSKRGLADETGIENGGAADLGGETPVDNRAPHGSSKEGC